MNELFLEARKMVAKKYNENDPNYFYILFSCYALLTKYKDCKDIVEYYILNTNVVIEEKLLAEMLSNHFENDEIPSFSEKDEYLGLAFNGIDLDENGIVIEDPYIFVSSIFSVDETLTTLIHEFSHFIKSFFKSYVYNSSGYFKVRCGMMFIETWSDNTINESNVIFEETINTLQTKDMTETIKNIDLELLSNKEKEFIQKLDFAILDKISGYETTTELLENIWKEEEFKDIFEDDLVLGNISNIKNNFNEFIGSDLFDTLSMALDNYFYLENEQSKELIMNIIKLFMVKKNEKIIKKTIKL